MTRSYDRLSVVDDGDKVGLVSTNRADHCCKHTHYDHTAFNIRYRTNIASCSFAYSQTFWRPSNYSFRRWCFFKQWDQ